MKFYGNNYNDYEPTKKFKGGKPFRGRPVRKQSRICFFVQVTINFDNEEENQEPALFVSRQVESDVIVFKSSKILKLPPMVDTRNGFLKVKVARRKLGKRLTEEIGVGVISLDDLVDFQGTEVIVPLWIPINIQENSCDMFLKELNVKSGKESPMGNLYFKVAFALVKSPIESCDSYNPEPDAFVDLNNTETTQLTVNPAAACARVGQSPMHEEPFENYYWNAHSGRIKRSPLKADDRRMIHCGSSVQNVFGMNQDVQMLYKDNICSSDKVADRISPTEKHVSDHLSPAEKYSSSHLSPTKKHLSKGLSPTEKCSPNFVNLNYRLNSNSIHRSRSMERLNPSTKCENSRTDKDNVPPLGPTSNYMVPRECNERLVHLEILEGKRLPLLRLEGSRDSCSPSCYVKTSVSSVSYETEVIESSSFPNWNYKTEFKLFPENLNHTNGCLILRVCHSLHGRCTHPDDPILGFASIETKLLWNSFLSICGWVPVLDLNGEIIGEIKVSLTPMSPPLQWQDSLNKGLTTLSINKNSCEIASSSSQPKNRADVSYPNNCRDSVVKCTYNVEKESETLSHIKPISEVEENVNMNFIASNKSSGCFASLNDINSSVNIQEKPIASLLEETMGENPQIYISSNDSLSNSSYSKEIDIGRGIKKSVINRNLCSNLGSGGTAIKTSKAGHDSASVNDVVYISEEIEGLYLNEVQKEQISQQLDSTKKLYQFGKLVNPSIDNRPLQEVEGSTVDFCCMPSRYSNPILESFTWMNQLSSFDTPCVSYIDISTSSNPFKMDKSSSGYAKPFKTDATCFEDRKPILKKKNKRCRIAAKFDFVSNHYHDM